MPEPKRKTRSFLAVQAALWNAKYPVGTPVTLLMDSGKVKKTTTRSVAYVQASGHISILLEGVSGSYNLDRVTPRKEES